MLLRCYVATLRLYKRRKCLEHLLVNYFSIYYT